MCGNVDDTMTNIVKGVNVWEEKMSLDDFVTNIREWPSFSAIEKEAFYIAEELGTGSTVRVFPQEYERTGMTSYGKPVYTKKRK